MPTVIFIGDRPADVPADWEIYNCPRFINGDMTWTGDFRHGTFYAAIDQSQPDADLYRRRALELDAYPCRYVSQEEVDAWFGNRCREHDLDPAEWSGRVSGGVNRYYIQINANKEA